MSERDKPAPHSTQPEHPFFRVLRWLELVHRPENDSTTMPLYLTPAERSRLLAALRGWRDKRGD